MRTSMNISLPIPLKTWVEQQVADGGYSTASEYVREVLRRQQAVEQARAQVDARLTKAIESGPSKPVDGQFWKRVRKEGLKRSRARGGK